MAEHLAYLLLGSNLGNRAALLHDARAQLAATAGEVVAASGLYETAAWGREDQPAVLNQALAIRTTLPAQALLEQCLAAERQAGRERRERWGARTIDLDLLWIDGVTVQDERLVVPHPRLRERAFALIPLLEVLPEAPFSLDGESAVRDSGLSLV